MVLIIGNGRVLDKELRKDAVEPGSPLAVLSMRHRIVSSTWRMLRMIVNSGTLFGRVSKVKLNTDEGVKEISVPGRNLAQETVVYWDRYGFHWGVATPSNDDALG